LGDEGERTIPTGILSRKYRVPQRGFKHWNFADQGQAA
jgi:hypothetical protein